MNGEEPPRRVMVVYCPHEECPCEEKTFDGECFTDAGASGPCSELVFLEMANRDEVGT